MEANLINQIDIKKAGKNCQNSQLHRRKKSDTIISSILRYYL